jgi:general L-amino acid transport system substrate-binding protein
MRRRVWIPAFAGMTELVANGIRNGDVTPTEVGVQTRIGLSNASPREEGETTTADVMDFPPPRFPNKGGGIAAALVAVAYIGVCLLASLIGTHAAMAQSPTLDVVRQRGHLVCGTNTGLVGFAVPDSRGGWSGFDVDLCRAVAAAIFRDGGRVRFVPLNAKERFTALQSGEVDILSRNTTWTMSRDTGLGLSFVGILYYDGQAFMTRRALGLKSVADLAGASICVQSGTTNELNLADFFATRGLSYRPVVYERLDEVLGAYTNGRCDAFTTDSSQLIAERTRLPDPDAHEILPDFISKEPLGPAVRQGDAVWANIVRWTLFAMINAEELGVTQANADEMRDASNPEIRRLLGTEGAFGRAIGLDPDWVVQIIKATGNYGECFERNLGMSSALKIPRGHNALWSKGGLLYAPPVR